MLIIIIDYSLSPNRPHWNWFVHWSMISSIIFFVSCYCNCSCEIQFNKFVIHRTSLFSFHSSRCQIQAVSDFDLVTCMWPKLPKAKKKKKKRKTVWFKLQPQWFRFHLYIRRRNTTRNCSGVRRIAKATITQTSVNFRLFYAKAKFSFFSTFFLSPSLSFFAHVALCTWTINNNELNFISAIFLLLYFHFVFHRNSFCKCFECWCVVKRQNGSHERASNPNVSTMHAVVALRLCSIFQSHWLRLDVLHAVAPTEQPNEKWNEKPNVAWLYWRLPSNWRKVCRKKPLLYCWVLHVYVILMMMIVHQFLTNSRGTCVFVVAIVLFNIWIAALCLCCCCCCFFVVLPNCDLSLESRILESSYHTVV